MQVNKQQRLQSKFFQKVHEKCQSSLDSPHRHTFPDYSADVPVLSILSCNELPPIMTASFSELVILSSNKHHDSGGNAETGKNYVLMKELGKTFKDSDVSVTKKNFHL